MAPGSTPTGSTTSDNPPLLRTPATREAPRQGKRKDIQGLRAIAVALVVLEHLLGKPVGGFVGVDIFFVISGYLITGQLLKFRRTNPRESIGSYFWVFYRNRIRRILPASLLVLTITGYPQLNVVAC